MARERAGWKSSASDFEFMVTVLLPIGFASCRCCAGECCGEDFVEGFDCGVDVLTLEKEGREQAKDCLAGAVDDDAALHHLGGNALGEVGGVDFDAEHEAFAADFGDAVVAFGELSELIVEVRARLVGVGEDVVALDGVDDGDGYGAGEWVTAERGAMHAGGDGFGGCVGTEHGAHGDAVGDGLGEGGDVGEDVVVLVGKPFAGAAHAGLDLVGDKECAGGVAEGSGFAEKFFRDRVDAAFALDRFDADGADFR